MEKLKTIDTESFEELVREHYPAVFLVAFSRVGNREAAEDLAQEAFLRSYLAYEQLEDPTRFAAWVCRIARNLAIDSFRSPHSATRLIPRADTEVDLTSMPDQRSKNARQQVMDREAMEHVEKMLRDLPADMREVVLLHYVQELNCKEIADRLGIHRTTVQYRLGRALSQCRKLLDGVATLKAVTAPSSTGAAKTVGALMVVAAMEGSTKAAIAAAATGSAKAASIGLAQAPATFSGVLMMKPLSAAAYAGGVIMGAKQVTAVVAVGLMAIGGGAYYTNVKADGEPVQRSTGAAVSSSASGISGRVIIMPVKSEAKQGSAIGNTSPEGDWTAENVKLRDLVAFTYGVAPTRVIGGEALPDGRFDVVVKDRKNAPLEALQAHIASTYGVRLQKERKLTEVMLLTAPNGKPEALKAASGKSTFISQGSSQGNVPPDVIKRLTDQARAQAGKGIAPTIQNMSSTNMMQYRGVRMEDFARNLELVAGLPVIDETQLPGRYDIDMTAAEKTAAGVTTSVRNQLGMELTPASREVEIVVVEKGS